jgi:hypothetical protein
METVMKKLARLAARFAAPYPVRYHATRFTPLPALYALIAIAVVAVVCLALLPSMAFAEAATVAQAPIADNATGGLISLWGPFLGVISSFVLFFDRLAKVIPNSTTNAILSGIRVVATILGAKVKDQQ